MVGAVQDVQESAFDEKQGRLMPARIQAQESRIAENFISSDFTTRGQESQDRGHARPQPRESRMNRKVGVVRADRILEHYVEHRLIPEKVRAWRQMRTGHVSQRVFVRDKRPV